MPQSLSLLQLMLESFAHVPVAVLQVLAGTSQVTAPDLPHVDRAVQLITRPLQRRGIVPPAIPR